jgi:hypothetical protein
MMKFLSLFMLAEACDGVLANFSKSVVCDFQKILGSRGLTVCPCLLFLMLPGISN